MLNTTNKLWFIAYIVYIINRLAFFSCNALFTTKMSKYVLIPSQVITARLKSKTKNKPLGKYESKLLIHGNKLIPR